MSELEQIKLEITPGEIIVNHGVYFKKTPEIILVHIDMSSKYVICDSSGSDDEVPLIFLDADKNTLHTDKKYKGEFTQVKFPEMKGWNIFSYNSCGRYSIAITFVKIPEKVS